MNLAPMSSRSKVKMSGSAMTRFFSFSGKSPRARDVARTPATRQTPLKLMKPPAFLIRLRSLSWEYFGKKGFLNHITE